MYDFMPQDEAYYRYEGHLTKTAEERWLNGVWPVSRYQISSVEERQFIELILNYKFPSNWALGMIVLYGGSTGRPQQPLNGHITLP
jgi:hypothetical protein